MKFGPSFEESTSKSSVKFAWNLSLPASPYGKKDDMWSFSQGGYSGMNVTGGGGGGGIRRIFLGLKFSTPVFFWVEDLTMYFFGSEKSARIYLGLNFHQANSSYAIQAKVPARSESMIRIICMTSRSAKFPGSCIFSKRHGAQGATGKHQWEWRQRHFVNWDVIHFSPWLIYYTNLSSARSSVSLRTQ